MNQPQRTYRVTSAADIEPRVAQFMWAGRIPVGTISIAAGRGGEGKSSFALWLAAELSRGTLPGQFDGKPRSTLYVSGEDHWEFTMLPRLMAADADLRYVHRLDIITPTGEQTAPILPVDVGLLRAALVDTGAVLVVIDPLLSSVTGDSYKASDMRQALEPLKRVVEDAGAVALGILHFSKGTSAHAGNSINGSTAFRDLARSVFLFARDQDEDARVMTQDKNSYARDDLPSLEYALESTLVPVGDEHADVGRFVWLGESAKSVGDVMRGDDDDVADRGEAERWIVNYLETQGGAAPASEIIKAGGANGYSRDTLKRASRKLVTKEKQGFQGAWVWTLGVDQRAQREQRERRERREQRGQSGQLHEESTTALPSHPLRPLLPMHPLNSAAPVCITHGTPTHDGQCGRCLAGLEA